MRWIIKIQASFRGHLVRKHISELTTNRPKSLHFVEADFWERFKDNLVYDPALFRTENA